MRKTFLKIFLFIAGVLLFAPNCYCIKHLEGNVDNPDHSFDFNIGPRFSFSSSAGDHFIIGADGAVANNFAVAVTNGGEKFVPLAPATITLNGAANTANPFRGVAVNFLSCADGKPVIVADAAVAADKKKIYTIETSLHGLDENTTISVLASDVLKDSNGADTNGIVGIGNGKLNYVFAAVRGNAGNFGAAGSGIAVVFSGKEVEKDVFKQIDSKELAPLVPPVVRATPLDLDSDAIDGGAGGRSLNSMREVVDFHWAPHLERLYVALDVTTPLLGGCGRAVAVGRFTNNGTKLEIYSITDINVFDNQDRIIGTTAANTQINIKKVRTMQTSTRLDYLICVRNDGAADRVYALPLINKMATHPNTWDTTSHGSLAAADSDCDIQWHASGTAMIGRGFSDEVAAAGQLLREDNVTARVGADSDLPGRVEDISVIGDSVYVAVGARLGGQNIEPGIFYSQAIFDNDGKVVCWTRWKRAGGLTTPTYSCTMDGYGSFTTLSGSGGVNLKDRVIKGEWSDGEKDGLFGGTAADASVGVVAQLENEFESEDGGVYRIFDFPHSVTPGLTNAAGDRSSMVVATGYKKVVLVEAGCDGANGAAAGNVFAANAGDFSLHKELCEDGIIPAPVPPRVARRVRMISVAGGGLDELGMIGSAEFAEHHNNSGFLFVGGYGGLGVLIDPTANGFGFDCVGGAKIKSGFRGINQTANAGHANVPMSFVKVGDYADVRKIMADGQYVYVLTDKKLDRIDLNGINFNNIAASTVTVASADLIAGISDQDGFSDFIVSSNFGMLATSCGLFVVDAGSNITAAVDWAKVDVPWSSDNLNEFAASKIFVVTPSGRIQRCAELGGVHSQVYVLSSYPGYDQSRLNRFYLNNVHDGAGAVGANALQALDCDRFIEGHNAFYVDYGNLMEGFSADGTFNISTSSKSLSEGPFVKSLPAGYSIGSFYLRKRLLDLPLDISGSDTTGSVLRCSASGSWLACGDFGLKVNE